MKKKYILLLFAFFNSFLIIAQEKQKTLAITFIDKAPKIDGILDDAVWDIAAKATDFVMLDPGLGNPEPENQKTEVKVLYDDTALYIGAFLYDDNPSSIPRQFAARDSEAQADFFEILINPFNDRINDTSFFVSCAGTQADAKTTSGREDFGWNAVWDSAVNINDDGWVVEIKIPYSVLRFSGATDQEWGINFIRMIKSKKEQYAWNFIDKASGAESEFPGLLTGIKNIDPPTRLSFYPFWQGTATHYDAETNYKQTAGLDLKYGINDSFTLDATLIPDFGQVAFDDVVQELGPFEVQHEEKRAFFTEGTELFNKGHLLYTRRIGDAPLSYYKVAYGYETNENEELIENPENTKMLNAVKLSGRTADGLGIGFFNAITDETTARFRNTLNDTERSFLTSPLTNYNVMVLDKTLARSSSVSFVNTNVMRAGSYADANVSSALLNFKTKNNKYVIDTDLSMSNHFENNKTETGYKGKLKLKEVLGSHRFIASVKFSDAKYDKNDLGIQDYNNFVAYKASYTYRTYKPKGNYNFIYIKNWVALEYRQNPYTYTDNVIGSYLRLTTKKHLSYGGHFEGSLGYIYDYYEPRAIDRFYKKKQPQFANVWVSTDYRKTFAFDSGVQAGFQLEKDKPHNYLTFNIAPRYRINNRMQLIYNFVWHKGKNEKGYVERLDDDTVFFGNRKTDKLVNSMQATYNASNKTTVALAFRHYWKQVNYDSQLYFLEQNGLLTENSHTGDYNSNFNMWNLDLSYTWEFAPGSQLVALYRNSLFDKNNLSLLDFNENLNGLIEKPATNEVSIKFIYYLDYNKINLW